MDVVEGLRMKLSEDCVYEDTYFDFILGLIHVVPWIITFAMMGISISTRELFYTVTSVVAWIDIILNYALTNVLADPAPLESCGGKTALPAFFTEHAFFMYVYLVMSYFIYNLRLNIIYIFLMQVWVTMAWISSVALGYNATYQIVWGAYVGIAVAIFVHIIIYFVVYKNRKAILESWVAIQFQYIDTIFKNEEVEYIEANVPDE